MRSFPNSERSAITRKFRVSSFFCIQLDTISTFQGDIHGGFIPLDKIAICIIRRLDGNIAKMFFITTSRAG